MKGTCIGGVPMKQDPVPSAPSLVLLAAVVAFQLAQGRCASDVELMAAFFVTLGDNLALLSTQLP